MDGNHSSDKEHRAGSDSEGGILPLLQDPWQAKPNPNDPWQAKLMTSKERLLSTPEF
jgi:hypothetical protein